jgi:hypothetical protein
MSDTGEESSSKTNPIRARNHVSTAAVQRLLQRRPAHVQSLEPPERSAWTGHPGRCMRREQKTRLVKLIGPTTLSRRIWPGLRVWVQAQEGQRVSQGYIGRTNSLSDRSSEARLISADLIAETLTSFPNLAARATVRVWGQNDQSQAKSSRSPTQKDRDEKSGIH